MSITSSKPIQKLSWSKKIAKDYKWFGENADYLISRSRFKDGMSGNHSAKIKALYDIYNSKFPNSWFKHALDPFNTGKTTNHLGQIRPLNIIRPNVEFMRGEYPKRPFPIQVIAKGEDGFTAFIEGKKQVAYKSMSQIFINELNSLGVDTGIDSKEVAPPDAQVEKFEGTFKNIIAAQAQTDLDLIIEDERVREKLQEAFKHWLIAGEVYSYKDVIRDSVIYEAINPLDIDYEISPGKKYIKDADWVVRRMPMLPSDVVDRFYDSLSDSEVKRNDDGDFGKSPADFSNWLHNQALDNDLIMVYHVTWRSYEKVGILTYPNPITGEMEQDEVNEDYKASPELGESIEWIWRTRWMELYRIGDKIDVERGPVRYSPSWMNDLAKTEGPYNGARFSDTNSENISVVQMGIPFLITYIIANATLERTMIKSRGKIVLLDENVIPKKDGWNEENFFSFSEAQGWATINRNQLGVDKSYNQYQVLDLGLFDHIKELIGIMDWCEGQFDKQLGISRQAKAQVNSSDTVGGTRAAVFQSSIITDMIFTDFENFARTDMEGLVNCSQIANINGKRSSWVSSEGRTAIININPEEYCLAQLGLMTTESGKEAAILERMKQYGQALAQNGMPGSGLLAIESANNVAKLQQVLLNIEKKQSELEQAAAESEQEAEMARIELQQEFAEFNMLLETQKMHEEYNRKEDLVFIQGDINMAMVAAENGSDVQDDGSTEALLKYTNERNKIEADNDRKNRELDSKLQDQKRKQQAADKMDAHKRKMAEQDQKLKSEIANKNLAIKKKQASLRPKKS